MSKLCVSGISMQFPGTLALDNVSLEFESGKVNALIGKNGCGKSTLVKIISGVQRQTDGTIYYDGSPVDFNNPEDALKMGIATVYQELSLIPSLTVAENVFIGRVPEKHGFVDWREIYSQTQEYLDDMGIDINPKTLVCDLSMWQCQMIEIAKAMSTNPKIIFLDEPTSSLSKKETETLFRLIRNLKEKDVIIIYITHRLQELWEIADTCAVLRDGRLIGMLEMKTATQKEVLNMMFGEVETKTRPADLQVQREVMLHVDHLSSAGKFSDVTFDLHKGEILGIAGMLGAGRTELLRAIFGCDPISGGFIEMNSKKYKKMSPLKMKEVGVGLTPEDRKVEGLIQVRSVKENLCVASLKRQSRGAFMDNLKMNAAVQEQIEHLQIKISSPDEMVSALSGGNQQKVVIGNWLNNKPILMMFDEPSRGIDVKAKQQIFEIIWELSRQGISSLVVSSELEELIEICHRILIMSDGRIVDEVFPENTTIEDLYALCMGGIHK